MATGPGLGVPVFPGYSPYPDRRVLPRVALEDADDGSGSPSSCPGAKRRRLSRIGPRPLAP